MKAQFSVTAAACLLANLGAALPTLPLTYPQLRNRNDSDQSALAQRIAYIAPKSVSCAEPKECRTNVQVAPLIGTALQDYGIDNAGAIAAVLALTALESVEYQYKHNVSPGRPGQGTSNMQMFKYNLLYAQSIPALAEPLAALGPISAESATDEQMDEVLALVTADQYNFGSGPWFLKSQCEPSVLEAFEKSADQGWAAYMACVGVPADEPQRVEYWTRAKKGMTN